MAFLPALAVIFAGVAGGHGHRVEKQVTALVQQLHVENRALPAATLKALTHHDATTRDLVRKLHVDGVIACEIVTGHGAPSLRVVIYNGDGKLASFSESPLSNDQLGTDDLDVLRDNLATDVGELTGTEIEIDPPAKPTPAPAKPTPAAKAPPAPAKPAPAPAPVVEPAPAEPAPDPDPAPAPATADATDDNAVSAADIEALTGSAAAEVDAAPHSSTDPELHIGAAVGIGLATRTFASGMSTLTGYSSSPVGAIHLAVDIQPTAKTRLALSTERTLGMTTPLDSGAASTTVARWEASGGYAIERGMLELAPQLGIGRRSFSISAEDPARSPDNAYDYLMLGAAASMKLGSHLRVGANAAFEPVIAGTEPTEMALGEATRWAIDAGAGVDVRFGHARVRAAADYQRFQWAWNMAGARGAGGATDSYVTGSLSVGAEY